MDKILTFTRGLLKDERINNLNLDLDTDYNGKCQFTLISKVDEENEQGIKVHKEFPWYFVISNYRFQVSSNDSLTKEQQILYEQVYGEDCFTLREPRSKICIYLENKNWNPDVGYVQQVFNFLENPKQNEKVSKMKRSMSSLKF